MLTFFVFSFFFLCFFFFFLFFFSSSAELNVTANLLTKADNKNNQMLRENDAAKQELMRIKNGGGTQVLSRIGTVRGIKGNVQSRIRHKTSNAATNWSSKILVAAMSKNRYFKHAEKHALELFLRTSEENMERATKSMKRRSSSNKDVLFPRRKWFRPGT